MTGSIFSNLVDELSSTLKVLAFFGSIIFIFFCMLLCFGVIVALLHQVLKYFSIQLAAADTDDEKQLYLNSSHEYQNNKILRWIHVLVEKAVFLRIDAYKNNPRGNFIWVIAILRVFFYYAFSLVLYGYFFSFSKLTSAFDSNSYYFLVVIASFFVIVNTIYSSIKQTFKSKWEYLADLYNTTLSHIENKELYELHENTLAIDIIVSMMWGHRSYKAIAKTQLTKAIGHFNSPGTKNEDFSDYGEKLKNNELTEKEAIKVLEKFQLFLLKQIKDNRSTQAKKERCKPTN